MGIPIELERDFKPAIEQILKRLEKIEQVKVAESIAYIERLDKIEQAIIELKCEPCKVKPLSKKVK